MVTFLRYWAPVCGYAGLIFYLSAQAHPEEQVPFVTHFSDKVLHAVEYAVFGALCYRALRGSGHDAWRQQAIPAAILLASLYGISDEVHQAFVPFRDSNWLDWVADTVGAAIGVTAMHRMLSLRPVRSIPEVLR
ncbi:MAG: VanZ family protein [Nitrospira sp.]